MDVAHRFAKKLREHNATLTWCIEQALAALHDIKPEMGQTVAFDGSDLTAYANGQKYVYAECVFAGSDAKRGAAKWRRPSASASPPPYVDLTILAKLVSALLSART